MATVTTIPADITNLKKEIDSIKSDVAKKLESSGGTITGDLTVVGGISGELSGNASTATKLKTARKINSVSFDGSKDINLTPEDIDALPITGGTLTGGLTAAGEIVSRSGNGFRIVQGNYGFFIRNDGSNTYFMLTDSGDSLGTWNSLRPLTINDASGGVTIGNGLTVNGSLGLGTENALGGNSIVLGDNDTGFKQNGDGILDVYANSHHVFRFQNGALQSNKPVNVAGQVTPTDYSNFDSRYALRTSYVSSVRMGSVASYGPPNNETSWTKNLGSGLVMTGIIVQETGGNSADNIGGIYYRPVQYCINGTWYTAASV
ncbi:TPA: hypothetical protein JLS70_004004 [Escherichia coli]|nr:hypothetical protein [Escherichia coli]HAW3269338.1 hypothetical protein [Escherichia coli]